MSDNVSRLGDKTGSAAMFSPLDALKDAINEYENEKRGAFAQGKKVLILALDDTQDNFSVSWIQAGMSMSQCIALCEVAKTQFLTEMEYINRE